MNSNINKALFIRRKREQLGLSQKKFASLIGLNGAGEATVNSWESGKSIPSEINWKDIICLPEHIPFRWDERQSHKFTLIDLFAGIGGMRLPFQRLGGKCVFSSEWDKFSRKTYAANFGEMPHGDITEISVSNIPQHDILLAGFPCQSFSQAGLKKGFLDTRGTMFFEIQRILAAKSPKAFLLENVKQLKGHNKGQTIETILQVLRGEHKSDIPSDIPMSEEARKALSVKLNYCVDFEVLRAGDFGVPQNRERVYIVGFNRDYFGDVKFKDIFDWPEGSNIPTRVGNILEDSSALPSKYTLSERLWNGHLRRKSEHLAKGNGFGYSLFDKDSEYANTISARYYKDGSEILIDQSDIGKLPRKLTPRECARLQGFPEEFIVNAVSDVQAYRQFGNSVAVPVVEAIAKQIAIAMEYCKLEQECQDLKSGEMQDDKLVYV